MPVLQFPDHFRVADEPSAGRVLWGRERYGDLSQNERVTILLSKRLPQREPGPIPIRTM
jgi:hypothetical protein